MPAFVNPVSQTMPGFGSPSYYGSITNNTLTATGTMTIAATSTSPTTGTAFNTGGGPAPSRGKIRLRATTVSAVTTTSATFTVTDGTTTLQVGQFPSLAAGLNFDEVTDFSTDLGITSISSIITLGGATISGIFDMEVSLV